MRLKDLFKPYTDMTEDESLLFINELRSKRIPLPIVKKSRKKGVELSSEEQALIDKIMKGIK